MKTNFNLIVLIFALSTFVSCVKETTFDTTATQIYVKWNKGYPTDTIQKAFIGLEWAMSQLGASYAKGVYQFQNEENKILIDVNLLGFSTNAVTQFETLHQKMRNSEEYRANGAIDMGRYVALLIGASAHYYAIVDMPTKLSVLLANYEFTPTAGYVTNSLIAADKRILFFTNQVGLNQLFLTEERDKITNELKEYETIDILPNGQLRYGIYDVNGDLIPEADLASTEAGKPGKCMWCHESGVQPLFTPQEDVEGYLSYLALKDTLFHFRENLQAGRVALANPNGVDFSETQDHAFMELLYTCFMEPSIPQLAKEWNMTIGQVESLVGDIETHTNPEYPYIGERLFRYEVNAFSPFQGLSVSSSVREPSVIEVNYLN